MKSTLQPMGPKGQPLSNAKAPQASNDGSEQPATAVFDGAGLAETWNGFQDKRRKGAAEARGPTRSPKPGQVTAAEIVTVGHAVGDGLNREATATAAIAIDAVRTASVLAGRGTIVTHGTVFNNGGQLVYAPLPKDKLVVPLPNGEKMSLKFQQVAGDVRSNDAFWAGEHELDFHGASKGVDLRYRSRRSRGKQEIHASGKVELGRIPYDVTLEINAEQRASGDSNGGEMKGAFTLRGTAESKAMSIAIDEANHSHRAYTTTRIGSIGDKSATEMRREINSTITVGEDTYEWKKACTQKSFRNGQASNLDTFWQADGAVAKNGKHFGSYKLSGDASKFQLELADNSVIDLESWAS